MRPDGLDAAQALGRYLRDPDAASPPGGIEARRLQVYRELFFNNLQGMLAGNFPVIHRIYGDTGWAGLVRDFYREHPARTPLFPELAREFLRYLELRAEQDRGDPPWLLELAHYEWVELALQISEAEAATDDSTRDVLDGIPVLSPLAWPLAYAWPVQQLGPDFLPDAPPAAPTLLLVRRDGAGHVRFNALSPLSFRLLQRIEGQPGMPGRSHLQQLADEAGLAADQAFMAAGATMLEQFRDDDVLAVTAPA